MTTPQTDRFDGSHFPVLAALATHSARPSAMWKLGLGAGLVGALGWVSVAARYRFGIALALEGTVALLVSLVAPMLAAQQLFADRQSGALDQQRLAGRTPREVLAAYTLGPSWAVYALLGLTTVATVACAGERELPQALGVALASVTAGLAWTVGAVALALGMNRSLPLNQAGGLGILGPLMRLPLYGLVLGVTRDRGWPGLLGFELLALALSARFALRRIAREEDSLDRSLAPHLALVASAAVATALGAAAARRDLAFTTVVAAALPLFALWATSPSRGATFRAWVRDGAATERRVLGWSALGAGLAGASVLAARLLASASLSPADVAAALFASALFASLSAVGDLRGSPAPQRLVNYTLVGVLALPSASWIASRIATDASTQPYASLTRVAGAPFAGFEGPLGFAARAALCAVILAGALAVSARALRGARLAAESRVPPRVG
ncbi:MAG: hypothetical protein R3A48_25785 [Polyangiales bacterium]